MGAGGRWAVPLLMVVAAILAGPAAAVSYPISEHRTVAQGSYFDVRVVRHGDSPYAIDVTWNSTAPVDVWLMRQADYAVYDDGTIRFVVQQNGTQGRIQFKVTSALLEDEPFHIVVDHTDKGPTVPWANSTDDTVTVNLSGEETPDVTVTWDFGSDIWLFLFFDLAVLAGIPLAIWFAYGKLKRRREIKRWEADRALRKAQAAALAAGGGDPQAAAAVGAAPAGADRFAALGSAKPTRSPVAQNWQFCGYCGAPLSPDFAFCRSCGRPLK